MVVAHVSSDSAREEPNVHFLLVCEIRELANILRLAMSVIAEAGDAVIAV